jgi:hypothetical protein
MKNDLESLIRPKSSRALTDDGIFTLFFMKYNDSADTYGFNSFINASYRL